MRGIRARQGRLANVSSEFVHLLFELQTGIPCVVTVPRKTQHAG
jgi:hypothetical protein